MNYAGRNINPVALWEKYVEFPANMDESDAYLPRVKCPNPNHDTLKRHFQINIRDGLVHCFAHCGISGSFEHALCVIHGYYDEEKVEDATDSRSRKQRLERARRKARREILQFATSDKRYRPSAKRKTAKAGSGAIAAVPDLGYEKFIPQFGTDYLDTRGISAASIAAWELGWDADERRIVIPGKDEHGHTKLLIRRAVRSQDRPKYLYTGGVPKTSLLFGACRIDPGLVRSLGMILTEGSLDTIRLHEHGLTNAVAILGTGISDAQRRILARYRPRRLYFMFDKDMAGIQNIEIAALKLRQYPLFVCRYPRGVNDPAELTKEEAYRVVARAVPLSRFMRKVRSVKSAVAVERS